MCAYYCYYLSLILLLCWHHAVEVAAGKRVHNVRTRSSSDSLLLLVHQQQTLQLLRGGSSSSPSTSIPPKSAPTSSSSNEHVTEFMASNQQQQQQQQQQEATVVYPALTREEISNALRDIPLYSIARKSDGGVLVARNGPARRTGNSSRDRSNTSGGASRLAAYFFLSRKTAEANLDEVVKVGGAKGATTSAKDDNIELEVTTSSLGKVWGQFFGVNNGRNADEKDNNNVEFRLVPDSEELLKARFLLTVTEKDMGGASGGDLSEAVGRRLMNKVNARPAKFKGSYSDIPLFVVPQMRVKGGRRRRRRSSRLPRLVVPSRRRGRDEMCLPVYFSMEDMTSAMQRVPEFVRQPPTTCVMDLGELLAQMGTESENFDLREVKFVPPGGNGDKAFGTPVAAADPAGEDGGIAAGSPFPGRGDSSPYAERHFWLRPRRRIRAQDYEELFGPDR